MASSSPALRRGPRAADAGAIPDEVLQCAFNYLHDPQDRRSVSEVCKQWHRIDGITRKHVEIPFCYAISPSALIRRFKFLESLKIKGKPRAYEFALLPKDWGGYAGPWVNEIVRAYRAIVYLHFKRMHVSDKDLEKLAYKFGNFLEVLKLDKCDGFSSLGLLHIARFCRHIKVIYLEDSNIVDKGGEWVHELALHHPQLETLNFALTPLKVADSADLELLAENCRGLSCLKVDEIDAASIKKVLKITTALQDFAMSNYRCEDDITDQHNVLHQQVARFELPRTLNSLSGDIILPLNPLTAANIKKLDLKLTLLSLEDQIDIIRCCINLEVLEVLNLIGDIGLSVLVNNCKKLRRLRFEGAGPDEPASVSPISLVSLAQNCLHLKFLALHVPNVSNAALSAIGQCCQQLKDFRLVLTDSNQTVTGLPLDEGMLAVMKGCKKLTRICIYMIDGGITDTGLKYIGIHGGNLKWALLGCVGDSDVGLFNFAAGCQSLEKLEMRACPFSESALCKAAITMKSLKYMWVEGRLSPQRCGLFRAMRRPYWNVEFSGGSHSEDYNQILAYFSLAGVRNDMPENIIPI